MARYCESCGKEMTVTATFCGACGKEQAPSAAGATEATPSTQAAGLQNNIAAALAYLWITAIVFLLLEPYNRDKFVRFHSFQALFLGLASIAGHIVLNLIPILGWSLMPLWSLLILVLAVVGAVKAYQNQTWRIPLIGEFAEKQV